MSSANLSDYSREIEQYRAYLETTAIEVLEDIKKHGVRDESIQKLLTLGVKLYFEKLEDGGELDPFHGDMEVIPSEMLRTVTQMMKQLNVELFELGLWQSWTKS